MFANLKLTLLASCSVACWLGLAEAAEPVQVGGTHIHVKNRTTLPMTFDLFFETTTGKAAKFDSRLKLEPGQTAIWKLKTGYDIKHTVQKDVTYYRVGIVGTDAQGRAFRWGTSGGVGMNGFENQTTEVKENEGTFIFRNIHVKPIGDL